MIGLLTFGCVAEEPKEIVEEEVKEVDGELETGNISLDEDISELTAIEEDVGFEELETLDEELNFEDL